MNAHERLAYMFTVLKSDPEQIHRILKQLQGIMLERHFISRQSLYAICLNEDLLKEEIEALTNIIPKLWTVERKPYKGFFAWHWTYKGVN